MINKPTVPAPTTIVIDNFGGRLTRKLNGKLNSGMAKFTQSFGYDPFSKPGNLTWLEAPTDISTGITDLMLDAKPRFESSTQFIYGIGSTGKLYKIQPNSITSPNLDSVVGVTSITANSPSFNFGASLEFFGDTEKIYIGSDTQINSSVVPPDGTADVKVGTTGYVSNVYRPLKAMFGKLLFGNGNTIGAIGSTGTVTSSIIGMAGSNRYSELLTGLPVNMKVTDLDASTDGNYTLITASAISNENIVTVSSDRQAASANSGAVYKWNGIDTTSTSFNSIPSYAVTAMQTYLSNNMFFANDSFGGSINDGVNKILTLPGNKSPFANSTGVNGNFVFWICPELTADGTGLVASMYYFGSLDAENPPGLYRVMRYATTLSSGFIYQVPVNLLTNNKYSTVNNALTAISTLGYGKHYFSTLEVNSSTTSYKFYRFLITPTGTGTAQLGVYETQTELFSKKMAIKQIRIYTEPTVTNNGFQVDLTGSDGNVLTNGTFNYSFVAGSDDLAMKGALQRIDFNPQITPTYALGVRLTNTGTANMTIKKVEVDVIPSGK